MAAPDAVTDLLVRLRDEGIAVTELSVQKPTLDEVFLTLTGRPATDEDAETPERELETSRS
jgi:ABC-2 type transport system ATP-binding protein